MGVDESSSNEDKNFHGCLHDGRCQSLIALKHCFIGLNPDETVEFKDFAAWTTCTDTVVSTPILPFPSLICQAQAMLS